jgi:hypothetical protein
MAIRLGSRRNLTSTRTGRSTQKTIHGQDHILKFLLGLLRNVLGATGKLHNRLNGV